jgi:hypothetical protein
MYYLKYGQASALADIKDQSAAPVFYNYYLIKHGLHVNVLNGLNVKA